MNLSSSEKSLLLLISSTLLPGRVPISASCMRPCGLPSRPPPCTAHCTPTLRCTGRTFSWAPACRHARQWALVAGPCCCCCCLPCPDDGPAPALLPWPELLLLLLLLMGAPCCCCCCCCCKLSADMAASRGAPPAAPRLRWSPDVAVLCCKHAARYGIELPVVAASNELTCIEQAGTRPLAVNEPTASLMAPKGLTHEVEGAARIHMPRHMSIVFTHLHHIQSRAAASRQGTSASHHGH